MSDKNEIISVDNIEKEELVANCDRFESLKQNQLNAYIFVANLIKSANKSILLIDNYIDEGILQLFTKRKKRYDY